MTHPLFIQQLLTRQPYPHSTGKIELRETHISWLLLTGDVAYKIKKPVDFGFVNFSTLEKRHHFCEEEVRLNRRLAPGIYQDVVAITGDAHAPCVGRDGDAFEYAVRMRQFDESQILLALLQAGELTAKLIDELAKVIAEFHGRIDRASESTEWGTLDQIRAPVVGNFEVMRPLIAEPSRLRQLGRLEEWSGERFESLSDTFASRRLQGFVRECHGDLHL
ncbi:MAG: hypothetical protein KDA80_23990, partial [Planctomycetaceae bacterium]|nr:hypothetical protein [Planctomycetaceae bacterium]